MRKLLRPLLSRRARVGLWLVANLPPVRLLAAVLLVRAGRRRLVASVSDSTGLSERELDRWLRRKETVKAIQRRLRRLVGRLLREL